MWNTRSRYAAVARLRWSRRRTAPSSASNRRSQGISADWRRPASISLWRRERARSAAQRLRHGCESGIRRRRVHSAPSRTRRDPGPIVALLVSPSGEVQASRCIHPGCADRGPQAAAAVSISSMRPFSSPWSCRGDTPPSISRNRNRDTGRECLTGKLW